jgi:flagellin-like hook-associated protein FlgL
MSVVVNSNVSALQAQRRLSQHTADLGGVYQRLSSGQRINRASDDAAGLSVASGLNTDKRVYTQGIRNINDGFSLLNIAEGAVEQLETIAMRIQELAEQAANGTLGWRQRASLDAEAQALSKEYTRIAQTTTFNGMDLFDGATGEIAIQAGYGTSGAIRSGLGGKVGDGTFGSARSFDTMESMFSNAISLGDLNGDGVLDMVTAGYNGPDGAGGGVTVRLGTGDGSFGLARSYDTMESAKLKALSLGDLNGDGALDMVTAGISGPDGSGGSVTIQLGAGDGTFSTVRSYDTMESLWSYALSLGDLNQDGVLDMVTAGYSGPDGTGGGVTVRLGVGDGTFGAARSYDTMESGISYALTLGDLNQDGVLDMVTAGYSGPDGTGGGVTVRLGVGDGSFGAARSYDTMESGDSRALNLGDPNGDGVLDIVTAGYKGPDGTGGGVTVRLGVGDGSFGAARSYDTMESGMSYALTLGDLNQDGVLDMVTAGYSGPDGTGGGVTVRLGVGDGSFGAARSYDTMESGDTRALSLGDLNGDGVLDIVTAGYKGPDGTGGGATVMLGSTTTGVAPLLPFSLKTKYNAKFSLELMKQKLNHLTAQRGTIGAFQSRLQTASNVISTTTENVAAAESQIRDADVAEEAARLLKLQILQQATAAVLGQANTQPQLALALLNT